MRQDPAHPHVVATGGKENALKMWDLQGSEEPVFRAKNVSDKSVKELFLKLREAVATDYASETRWALEGKGGLKGGAHQAPHSPVPHLPTPPGAERLAGPAGSHLGPGHTVSPRITEACHLHRVPPGKVSSHPYLLLG